MSRLSHYLNLNAEFIHVFQDNEEIVWKQNQGFFKEPASRRQVYKLCDYMMPGPEKKRMPVYVQSDWGIPKPLKLDKDTQFGESGGITFLVFHDKDQKPYQSHFKVPRRKEWLISEENQNNIVYGYKHGAKFVDTFSGWATGVAASAGAWLTGEKFLEDLK